MYKASDGDGFAQIPEPWTYGYSPNPLENASPGAHARAVPPPTPVRILDRSTDLESFAASPMASSSAGTAASGASGLFHQLPPPRALGRRRDTSTRSSNNSSFPTSG